MDLAFNTKYKVLKNVYNILPNDTVSFKVFDHYGRPGFEDDKYVLLYISKYNDSEDFYHQKYQYDPMQKVGVNWRGLNGENLEKIFDEKRKGVLMARGIFN